jgi:hypothetical protein
VAEDLGVAGGIRVDASFGPPVEVGTAKTDGPHPDEQLARTRAVRDWFFNDFDALVGDKWRASHEATSLAQSTARAERTMMKAP